jgi:two-component system, OmpR family, response regulator
MSATSVLIVEDEAKIARLLTRALTAAGFEVTTALTGVRGLRLAKSATYGLIILDLVLPDVDGLSILSWLREEAPAQQVIVLSALADVHSKVRCLEVGACDYVTKPFVLAEVVARVRLRLKEQQDVDGTRFLAAGGFTLDRRHRTVANGGPAKRLSTREFVLLEHLMRHAGDVCPRQVLLEEVWGYTFDPSTNVLDVYVARLRQKLGAADSILTVRNVGYTFVGD